VSTLLVASGGGHLRQLVDLQPRLSGVDEEVIWVTWDAPQSRSLLKDRQAVFVRPTPPRAPLAVASNIDHALRLWTRCNATALVTTGSQLVLPFLAVGRLLCRPCHFIESAARSQGPSLTATIAARLPGVQLYTQYPTWEDRRWRYVGSVFDRFSADGSVSWREPKRVVVTLGTMPGWSFRRLLEHCIRVLPADTEVTWQTGSTDVSGLGIHGVQAIAAHELETAIRAADVVVSHAGAGSALTALNCGKKPILVPRSAALGEHVDDHQYEVADELARRGLALYREPEALSLDDLREVANTVIEVAECSPPIRLVPAGRRSAASSRVQ
jgi:UDP-N-acetylglucosamine--N-acetylmuramyl-(pentapeptide) pyrophosphoryl-undecaprenol N-acetylglucosamine transferase